MFPLILSSALLQPARIDSGAFPVDPSVIDVRTDFGAVGNGIADDTAALQAALNASQGLSGGANRIVYIPNGTYRLTSTLVVKGSVGPWVYGQSRAGAVLKLDDGVAGITSLLRTHINDSGEHSADYFNRNFRSLTLDVGNNPGVDGVRWFSNNTGILKDVLIRGSGNAGVRVGFAQWAGPSLIQDVEIEGFQTGITTVWNWGQTLSRIRMSNIGQVGLEVQASSVAVEGLVCSGVPQGVRITLPNDWSWWGGNTVLLNSSFTGGNLANPAVWNSSYLYARGIQAQGYARVLRGDTPGGSVEGGKVGEYASLAPRSALQPGKPVKSLELPVKTEPQVAWENNPANWVSANDFGADIGDDDDDGPALQAAIDLAAAQGKTVVTLRGIQGPDPNWYWLKSDVTVKAPGWTPMIFGPYSTCRAG